MDVYYSVDSMIYSLYTYSKTFKIADQYNTVLYYKYSHM